MHVHWEEDFILGIPTIDMDHQHLFELINHLGNHPHDAVIVEEIVRQLTSYVEDHFRREERILEASGYANLDRHKRAHQDLEGKIMTIRGQRAEDVPTLQSFLYEWLSVHILHTDRAYTPHVLAWLENGGLLPEEPLSVQSFPGRAEPRHGSESPGRS